VNLRAVLAGHVSDPPAAEDPLAADAAAGGFSSRAATEQRPDRPGGIRSSPGGSAPRLFVARAELTLAAGPTQALREVPLRPDPLQSVAAAVYDVREDLGERVDICLDLLPLTPARAGYLRRKHARPTRGRPTAPGWQQLLDGVLDAVRDDWRGGRSRPRGRTVPPSGPVSAGKLDGTAPLFAAQLLIRVESEIPGRPEAHLAQILAAFRQWAAENRWKVHGVNLGVGRLVVAHLGADSVLYRRRFDRRFTTGRFDPPQESLVTPAEIGGLLKPPTRHCAHLNVARSGGMVPPPPKELPVYRGQPGVVPLGYAPGPDGEERLLGCHLDDLLFSFRIGKSGFGKTEEALAQAAAIALGGGGVWFLDPHADGWKRIRPYLAEPELRDRLWDVDLTVRGLDAKVASWNPLSMEGRGWGDIEYVVDCVVTAFASTLAWGDSAPRAKAILTKACQTLCELARRLPPDAQPTIFQLRTLLDDEEWREQVLPSLPPGLQSYWRKTFPKMPGDATPVITNLIERISASATLTAFLGASRSSYDVRRAMDEGKVVFVCPPGQGEASRLVSCFLIYDLFRAGRSREDLPSDDRRRFDAFIDELTAVDGAARGYLAAILEQLRKFGVSLHAMTQMADRLSPDTRKALLQNQSLLASTAGEIDAVRVATRQWGKIIEPETVANLPKYHHVMTATVAGQVTTPFKVRGPEVTALFADHHHPELLEELEQAADANLRRRYIRDVLDDLDTLDERILRHLAHRGPTGRGRPAAPPSAGPEARPGKATSARAGRASGAAVDLDGSSAAAGTGTAGTAGATAGTGTGTGTGEETEALPDNVVRLVPRHPGVTSTVD
jgi:hypothetical protein